MGKRIILKGGEIMAYTIRKCKKCGTDVKIDFLEALLNLDKEVICKNCKGTKEVKE